MRLALKIIGGLAGLVIAVVIIAAAYVYMTAFEPARRIAFQNVAVADPGHPDIVAALWYPTTAKPGFMLLGASGFMLADGGPVDGERLPLIIFSHGTGAASLSHSDTAIALAEKGFIVIAPTHTGDNFRDSGDAGKPVWFVNRARHVERTIDAALTTWKHRQHVDAARIGIFGFSAGATTALINIGGRPDLSRIWSQCEHSPEFICNILSPAEYRDFPPVEWKRDHRIRAAVLAAPGAGFAFAPSGVTEVDKPVQLWVGSADDTVPLASNAGLLGNILGQRAEMHIVPKANHYSFLMPCGLVGPPQICADPEGFDRRDFHRRFNAEVATFFARQLR
ncbi:MAG: dienelactone hydrolase family protein [Sphingomonas sp.]|nr:dienelactone hydrolase family protein [Sphingomonas sp.]